MTDNPFQAPSTSPSTRPAPTVLPTPPAGEFTPGRVEKGLLVVPKDGRLPAMCVCCGRTDSVELRSLAMSWHPLLAKLAILLGVVIGLLAMLATRKSAVLIVALCPDDDARLARLRTMNTALMLGGLLFMVTACFASTLADELGLLMGLVGLMGFVGAAVALGRLQPVRATYMDEVDAWYAGVHPDVMAVVAGTPRDAPVTPAP